MMRNPWTAFFDWYKGWSDTLRTTNHVIIVGSWLAVVYVFWALAADSLGRPLKELTLNTVGLFITGMIAGGVAQFGLKRMTDDKVVAARTGASIAPRATTAIPAVREP